MDLQLILNRGVWALILGLTGLVLLSMESILGFF